ncbi:MAG TPA: hypothetical protein VM219_05775 [Phycisphaerae bacterium]|nr:hypothetical protein [Phycisphaerae bacterium]
MESDAKDTPADDVMQTPALVRTSKVRSTPHKMPWDVVALGWISYVSGVVCVLGGILFLALGRGEPSGWEKWTLFGTVHVTGRIGFGVWLLIYGILFLIEGWGLLRGRSWAWWLMLGEQVEYAVSGFSHPSLLWSVSAAIVINALVFGWLLFRAKLFRPFGRRTDARPTGPG